MNGPSSHTFSPWLRALVLLLMVAAPIGWMTWSALRDPRIGSLPRDRRAEWITYPHVRDLNGRPVLSLEARFEKTFTLTTTSTPAILELRAFREGVASLNGRDIWRSTTDQTWKLTSELNVSRYLIVGENRLSIRVLNDRGPPALWGIFRTAGLELSTDETWTSTLAGAVEKPARLATSAVPEEDQPFPLERTIDCLWALKYKFAAIALATLGLLSVVHFSPGAKKVFDRRAPEITLLVAGLLWIILFVHNRGLLSPAYGFDSGGHRDYVEYVRVNRSLPRADQGWEMFQPPLYYVMAATVNSCTGTKPLDAAGAESIRLLGLLGGLVQITAIYFALKAISPERPDAQAVGVLFAGFLPAHIFLFSYITNEGWAASLCSVAIAIAAKILMTQRPGTALFLLLGVVMGLALLTKATAILVLAAIVIALFHDWVSPACKGKLARLARVVGLVSVALGIGGWHYFSLWKSFGNPLLGNWDVESGFAWWQDPGYLTLPHFFKFWDQWKAPFFSSTRGVLGAIYTTFWGDGAEGGSIDIGTRPPWNHQWMAAGFALALAPTFLMALGLLTLAGRWMRSGAPIWTLILALVGLFAFAIVWMNVKLPFHSLAKGFFAVSASTGLAVPLALGYQAIGKRTWARVAVEVVLLTWAANSYLSFWIDPAAPETHRSLGAGALNKKDGLSAAAGHFREVLKLVPGDPEALSILAMERHQQGKPDEAERLLREAILSHPRDPGALVGLAIILEGKGEIEESLVLVRRALDAAPNYFSARVLLGKLLRKKQDDRGAIAAYREALRIHPANADVHGALADLYLRIGDDHSARFHANLQSRIAAMAPTAPQLPPQ